MKSKTSAGLKIISLNRKASFNFFFQDLLEAGIVLKGSEIKSVRAGKINIADSYGIEKNGEIYLINSHIPIYKEASYSNHNPLDERKLLDFGLIPESTIGASGFSIKGKIPSPGFCWLAPFILLMIFRRITVPPRIPAVMQI